MGRLIDSLQAKVLELAPDLLGDGSDVDVNLPAIDAILEDLDPIFADGFQWDDIPKALGAVVPELMELAGTHAGKSGEEKKQFVVDAVTVIYFHYNPNLPLVPDAFGIETRLEKMLVPKLAEVAIEAAFKLGEKIRARLSKD